LSEEEPIFQKRVLSVISGAILPLVSLGFIKALVDYIRPEEKKEDPKLEEITEEIAEGEFIEDFKEKEESAEEINPEINSSRRLKDTVYYDLDPTKIS
jgi:hypothetical protein